MACKRAHSKYEVYFGSPYQVKDIANLGHLVQGTEVDHSSHKSSRKCWQNYVHTFLRNEPSGKRNRNAEKNLKLVCYSCVARVLVPLRTMSVDLNMPSAARTDSANSTGCVRQYAPLQLVRIPV